MSSPHTTPLIALANLSGVSVRTSTILSVADLGLGEWGYRHIDSS